MWQDINDAITVADDRFDGAPARTLKVQPSIRGGYTL